MTRPRFAWRSVAVLGVAALALGACGDGGKDSQDGTDEQFEGTLTVGMILPTTGGLATYGVGMMAAVHTAAEEINAAGGVWGNDVKVLHENEGPAEEPDVVAAAADSMIRAGGQRRDRRRLQHRLAEHHRGAVQPEDHPGVALEHRARTSPTTSSVTTTSGRHRRTSSRAAPWLR